MIWYDMKEVKAPKDREILMWDSKSGFMYLGWWENSLLDHKERWIMAQVGQICIRIDNPTHWAERPKSPKID